MRGDRPFAFVAGPRSRIFSSWLLATAIGCGSATPDPQPQPPPAVPVVATGDGAEVAGYFGPPGGEIRLAETGPSVVIPPDKQRKNGVALGLRRDAGPSLEPGAIALGEAFRPTAVFEPPSNVFVEVWSIGLSALAAPCTEENLEVAVQEPQQVGPADGESSPVLAWTYRKAQWADQRVKARLAKLTPYPLQFICARSAGGGT
jgi:hypothetical protein